MNHVHGNSPDKVVKFVEDSVDNLDQQMSLLIFESRGHEEGEDLVEEGGCAELARFVRYLSHGGFTHGRGSVLDFQ